MSLKKMKLEKITNIINNFGKPAIEINHSDLIRIDDSIYRRKCPSCDNGLLLVTRDSVTLVLQEFDICICCGQKFKYMDITLMRQNDWSRTIK
jgi:RNase P subunit RPR2